MVNGIRIVGNPKQVADTLGVLALTFKGATLAEVSKALRLQQITTAQRKQFADIFKGDK